MGNPRVKGLTCTVCPTVFDGRKNSKYCSWACKNQARREAPAPAEKRCARCEQILPVEEFGKSERANRTPGKFYYSTYCLACRRAATDPAVTRRRSLKKRYGITPEDFDRMLAEQGGCLACKSPTTNGKYWHIDHDHACCPSSDKTCGQCIRGILCHGCNTALGNLGDDPEKVWQLYVYILHRDGVNVAA